MTSAFIIGVTSIFLWVVPKNQNTDDTIKSFSENPVTKIQENVSLDAETESKQYSLDSNKLNMQEVNNKNLK